MVKGRLSTFYARSSLFAVLSIGAALLNYALYPFLAHILSPLEFGNFTAIVALSNQILAILLAFNVISIYLVKKYPEAEAREKTQVIQKFLIWFFLAATVLMAVLSPVIKNRLKIDNPMAFVVLALMLITTVPAVIWTGYLQGHKRLDKVGIYAFSGSFFKFIFAILLGSIAGTTGALFGVLLGTLTGIIILKFSAAIRLPKISSVLTPLSAQEADFLRRLASYVAMGIVVVGGLGFMQNIDIIFAKAFFTPNIAGVYSGVSILSNAIYYVAFLLIWIVLPEIGIKDNVANVRVLKTAYGLLGLLAIGALIVELIFRNLLAEKLLGSGFANQGVVLIYATLFQISLVAVSLYAFYMLVLRNSRSLILALCVMVACLVLPWLYHDTPKQMIISLWSAVLLGFAIYCIINRSLRFIKYE